MYAKREENKVIKSNAAARAITHKSKTTKQNSILAEYRPEAIYARKLRERNHRKRLLETFNQSSKRTDFSAHDNNIIQRLEIYTEGDEYKSIGTLNALEVAESALNLRYRGLTARAETIAEMNRGPGSVVNMQQQIGNINVPINENDYYIRRYINAKNDYLYTQEIIDRYNTIPAGNLATFNAHFSAGVPDLVTPMNTAKQRLDSARQILESPVIYNYKMIKSEQTRFQRYMQDITRETLVIMTAFNSIKQGGQHSPLHYLEIYRAAPAAISHDQSDAAYKKLVILGSGLGEGTVYNDAWMPLVKKVIDNGDFENGTSNNMQNVTPPEKKDFVQRQKHSTMPGGGTGYNGRSLWGTISGGKLTIQAIAEHYGTGNKNYRAVERSNDMPGRWSFP